MDEIHGELMKKRHYLVKKKILFHDDAPAHMSTIYMGKMIKLHHVFYSTHLVPCDVFLLIVLRKHEEMG